MGKRERSVKLISVMVSATLATGMVPAAAFAQSAPASLDQGVGSASPAATEIAQASETEAQQQSEEPEAGVQPLEAEAPAGQAMSGQCGATEKGDVAWALVRNNADDKNPTYTLSFTGKGAMEDWREHRLSGNNSCGTDSSATECKNPMCALNRPWAAYLENITKVTISEGITRLGSESLLGITNVDSIELPESLKYIGFGSMAQMTSLSSITIPDATKAIETSAFYGDSSLAAIGFSDAGNLEEIGDYAFSGAAFSGELSLPEGLKRIGIAPFERCQGVTEFVIPSTVQSYDVSSSGLNGLFNGAKGSLKKVTIKSSADLPGYMFQGQNALESVEIAGDVTSIGKSAFNNCTKLSSVSGTGSVKTFGEQAFRYDSQLRRIDLSGAETIEGWCFDRAGLVNAAAPNASTIGSGAFDNCGSLSSLTLGGGSPKIPNGIISSDYSLSTVDLTSVESFDKVFKGELKADGTKVGGAFTYWGNGSRADQLTAFYFSDRDMAENAMINFRMFGTHAIFASTNGGELNGATADKGLLATPTRSGYTFAGWYQDKTFETPYKNGVVVPSGSDAYTNSNLFYKHFYAYAKWNSAISFDANGGTLADSDSAKRDVVEGESLGELATPTLEGYKFGGWFTEKGAGKEVNSKTVPTGNATYYAHWLKVVDGSTYYVNPVVPNQTYTGEELKPAISVTKDGQSITEGYSVEYTDNVNAGTATATVKVGSTVIGTASFDILKAVPEISITSSEEALLGGGTVTLAVEGAPAEGELTVSCDDPSISVSKNEEGHYTAFLPNATKDYTFTASYTPNGNYEKPKDDATATVHVSYYDPSYPVNIDGSDIAGGSVAASPTSAVPGQKVVLTPKADAGHVLGYLKVKDANGNELELEDNGDGSFSFVMPSGKVAVEASFPIVTFPDVDYSQWYAPGVDYMADKGLMTGYSDTGLFGVGKTLTRGELATILWRNACPEEARAYVAENAKDETDIAGSADGKFYTAAANWAVASGAITGIVREDGSLDFAAEENVTFEQLITVLARIGATDGEVAAAGADLSAFLDGANASAWSAPSLKWAADKGLVEGYDTEAGRLLAPGEDVARERVATVLMRAFEVGILK